MDGCTGCRHNTGKWLLNGFTCFHCQEHPHEKKLAMNMERAKKRLGVVLNHMKKDRDNLQNQVIVLESFVVYLDSR
jgi:hypothetical protein